jgi:hypothetical protein
MIAESQYSSVDNTLSILLVHNVLSLPPLLFSPLTAAPSSTRRILELETRVLLPRGTGPERALAGSKTLGQAAYPQEKRVESTTDQPLNLQEKLLALPLETPY